MSQEIAPRRWRRCRPTSGPSSRSGTQNEPATSSRSPSRRAPPTPRGTSPRHGRSAYRDTRGAEVANGSKRDPRSHPPGAPGARPAAQRDRGRTQAIDPTLLALSPARRAAVAEAAAEAMPPRHSFRGSGEPADRHRAARLRTRRDIRPHRIEPARVRRRRGADAPARHLRGRRRGPAGCQHHAADARPRRLRRSLILGIGLLLALALPVLIDRMDHTIRDAKTATAAFSAPVLSSIPADPRPAPDEIAKPGTAREAAFRALAATSVATDRLPRSIVVTSPLGEEQDSVAANFAAALAGLGVRVALVGTSPRQAWFSRTASATQARNGTATATARQRHGAQWQRQRQEPTTFPQLLELAYSGRLNGEAPEHLHAARGSRTCSCCRRATPTSTCRPTAWRRCCRRSRRRTSTSR